MKKRATKSLVFGITIALLTTLVVLTVPMNVSAQLPTTVWVDDDWTGPGDDGGHNWGTDAFDNIQDGIDGVEVGGTVIVYAGTYTENVIVNKRLTLDGESRTNTIVDGNSGGDVMTITADWVNVSGFRTINSGTGLTGNTWRAGIKLYNVANTTINNNNCLDNTQGIYLLNTVHGTYSTTSNTIMNNICMDNTAAGIYMYDSTNNLITNNTCYLNEINGIVSHWHSDNNIINNNTCSQNTPDGIYLRYILNNSLNNNTLMTNENGINLWYASNNMIENNNCTDNNNSGIYFDYSNNNSIEANEVHDNREDGIRLGGSDENTIKNNKIYDNDGDSNNIGSGIHVEESDWNTIEENLIYNSATGSQQYGIHLFDSEKNLIQNHYDELGSIFNNDKEGIFLDECKVALETDRNQIIQNWIFDNGESGILIKESIRTTIDSNILYQSSNTDQKCGIFLEDSEYIDISSNVMTDQGIMITGHNVEYWNTHIIPITNTVNTYPVRYWKDRTSATVLTGAGEVILANCQDVTVNGQVQTNGGTVGILSGFSHQCIIDDNTCNSNHYYGICMYSHNWHNTLSLNTCNSNGYHGISLYGYNWKNTLSENTCDSNAEGICLYSENWHNTLFDNTCSLNTDGIYLYQENWENTLSENTCNSNTNAGIYLCELNDCNILYNNIVKFNEYGILLDNGNDCNMLRNNLVESNYDIGIYLENSDNNVLENNDIDSNINYGLMIVDSVDNSIFHNNFINNNGGICQAYDNGNNFYDDRILTSGNGYPKGGNYWDDFESSMGVTAYDDYRGPAQNLLFGCIGDGIIDQGWPTGGLSPYNTASGSNTDDYPLILPIINDRVQRPPFRINSNADFDAQHGVSSGSGTQNDPWIIEGWYIDGTGFGNCIYIGNTTDYFVIRDCYVFDASGGPMCPWYQDAGITLYSVCNGLITSLDWNVGEPHATELGFIIVKPTISISNDGDGIMLHGNIDYPDIPTQDNIISNCIILNNGFTGRSNAGVMLYWFAISNLVKNNIISDNEYGIRLPAIASSNTIIENDIMNNLNYGVEILGASSSNNYIYHNNFYGNNQGGVQAFDNSPKLHMINPNNWDNGYPTGGNYWDDFETAIGTAFDDYQGINQQTLNTYLLGDGIIDLGSGMGGGKKPYIIAGGGNNEDGYPLLSPFVEGRVQRPPIRIDSNSDFDASHGVISGSGIQNDPWIIENWDIDGTGYRYCLYIGNTTNYFEIRNCYLHDASGIRNTPYYPNSGIVLYNVQNGLITNNLITNNYVGIYFSSGSQSNNIIGNTISYNTNYGIEIKGLNSNNNNIYHNNFIENNNGGPQAYDECSSNQWDNGYPSGGNYWDEWTYPDEYSGASQDQSGSDGIVDESYSISGSANAVDNYPKMRPF